MKNCSFIRLWDAACLSTLTLILVGMVVRLILAFSLAALRLHSAADKDKTLALRRDILGLFLVAFTSNAATYLRAGCNLVPSEKPREFKFVHSNGKREDLTFDLTDVFNFATEAAKAFGVAAGGEVVFDPKLAIADVQGEGDVKATRKKPGKKGDVAAAVVEAGE